MSVDIVIVNFNTRDLLRECLRSVTQAQNELPDVRAIVVDNASSDDSVDMVRQEFPSVEVVALPENVGFGAGNNRGVEQGDGEHILFLNSDAQLTPEALPRMLACLEAHSECVAVGPRLVYPDGTFQPSCRRFPTVLRCAWSAAGMPSRVDGNAFNGLRLWLTEREHTPERCVEMVSGACFLMRRGYFEEVGGFDENLFLFEEEFDLFYPASLRGLELRYCSAATVIHGSGKSVEANRMGNFARFHLYRSRYRAFRKHYGAPSAMVSYGLDLLIFGVTGSLKRIMGQHAEALVILQICRRAWATRELSGEEIRTTDLRLPD